MSSIVEMFALDPLPFPVLLFVTIIIILLAAPSYFSFEFFTVKPDSPLSLLVTSVALVPLIKWKLSSNQVSKTCLSMPRPGGCCQSLNCCLSEGLFPWLLAALIVVLLILGQYQNVLHDRWFFGFYN
ncbi:hypothetical protein Ddye_007300 [Dipteronia dyeriana]|uniref:Uncharacterized protein n=1 Tax=Dipteronia dyeriana TaxID=168575 RepID=A0AAD9XKB0_9ROSI|nr:hypothetical protein Ddye_007300 [Dipteronia dyeriana]